MVLRLAVPRSFLWLNSIPLCGRTTFYLSIPSIDGNLGRFHLLAVNNTTVNLSLQISLWDPAFTSFGYKPRSAISGSDGSSIFHFLRKTPYCFLRWLYRFTFRSTVHQCFGFSRPLSALVFSRFFCLVGWFFLFGLVWDVHLFCYFFNSSHMSEITFFFFSV